MLHDRRSFLRNAVGLSGISMMAGFGGCVRSSESLGDVVAPDDGKSPNGGPVELEAGTELGIVPTAMGGLLSTAEVDPEEPGGGRLVTIDEVDPGEAMTVSWRRTVEQEVPPREAPSGEADDPTLTPSVNFVEETGTITATGLSDSHEPFLPMYWQPGNHQTATSGIWLSVEAFRDLTATDQTSWSRDVLTRISRIGVETASQIDAEVAAAIRQGAETVEDVILRVDSEDGDVELTVDGEPTTLSTIDAYDSFGNAYQIIDTSPNPLIATFTYDAVSVGFSGFDTALWTLIKTVFSGYRVVSVDAPNP